MSDSKRFGSNPDEQTLRTEIVRLNKVVNSLMDRAERSTNVQGSDFSMFQTTIMLEDQVRRRTAELEVALRENERVNHAFRVSEAKFRGLVSQSLVGIAIVEDGKFSYVNLKYAEMFGYGVEELLHLGPLDITAESDRPLVAQQMQRRLSREMERIDYVYRGLCKDGTGMDIECHGSVLDIGGKLALMSLILDITERTRAGREVQALQDQLREQAIRDPLTGLYNRRYLNEFFDRELSLAVRRRLPISAVMADLDKFKAVNDTYGHHAGDEVLRVFGGLMKQFYRASDICCRYGGEEFLAVLPDMANDSACRRTEELRSALENTPIVVGTSIILVTASFGIATFPQDGKSLDPLVAAADKALYAAKHSGRNQVKGCSEIRCGNSESNS
jgi:diguanylate cyclase (GGDEF)-like protein/PAS domain S-box-containing protein